MSEWTEAAKRELENYLNRARAAGTDEVAEDLRNHVHEEVAAAGMKIVTEEDVRCITARLGLPEGAPEPPPTSLSHIRLTDDGSGRGAGMVFLLVFGVILPVVALGFEIFTAMCAAIFFDPIPTWFHAALVAFVPAANFCLWRALRAGRWERRQWHGWVNGIAVGIGIFYSLMYLPMMPLAVIGIIWFGLGLLPWSPLFAVVSTLFLRARLRGAGPQAGTPLPGLGRGIAIGLLALLALNSPVWLTRFNLQRAVAEDEATQASGLRWLRAIGHEETMLRACYGTGWRREGAGLDPVEWLLDNRQRVSSDRARTIFYRVTGRPFNTLPAPKLRTARGGTFDDLNDWTWDEDQGGEKVGGRIKGLTLHSSRLDALVENDAALAYCEWIMEFKNDSRTEREARAQIQLPPGAVVSRLTLWVNGEEREGAFAGRSQVRQAYQQVAIRQRRDPVLVNTCGPDRILMQCFPVPREGGVMKLRIGMSVPVVLDESGQGLFRLPAFIERNFSIRESFKHSVWLKSSSGKLASAALGGPGANSSVQGQLPDRELGAAAGLVRVERNAAVVVAWAKDPRATGQPALIAETLQKRNQPPPARTILVLDHSPEMADILDQHAGALAAFATNAGCGVVVAGDDNPQWLLKPQDEHGPGVAEKLARQIRGIKCNGGYDNVPALLAAWDAAGTTGNAVVLWVHAPQSVELSSTEPLLQRIERNGGGTDILSFATGLGPNYVLEKLDGHTHVRSVARLGNAGEDLKRLATSWNPDGGGWVRSFAQLQAPPANSVEASDHLVRLWMRDELVRLRKAHRVDDAIPLATRYQLVTPVSGAVVLETAQQYAANGLTPADPQTVPSIPEPTTTTMVLVAALVLWLMRRRGRRNECSCR